MFHYASNNCQKIKERQPVDFEYGQECFHQQQTLSPIPFDNLELKIGLPDKYPVMVNNDVILSYIHVIGNGIVTRNGDVHVDGLRIVPYRRCMDPKTTGHSFNVAGNYKIYNEVFTIAQAWGTTTFHGSMNQVPRLAPYLKFLLRNKNVKIHIQTGTDLIMKMLLFLGFDEQRIIIGDVRAHIIYMPGGSHCTLSGLFNMRLLSMYLRLFNPAHSQPRRSIVMIKRIKRPFLHELTIKNMIKDIIKNTTIKLEIFTDNPLPSLYDTAALFNRAFMVIAPHGAGNLNLLFSEPGTILIDTLWIHYRTHRPNLSFRDLCRFLGQRYYGYYPSSTCFCVDTTADELRTPIQAYINSLYLK